MTIRKTTSEAGELEKAREDYQYNYDYLPPVAMVDKLPKGEIPDAGWWLKLIEVGAKILGNKIIARRGEHGKEGFWDDIAMYLWETACDILKKEGLKLRSQLILMLIKSLPKIILKGFKVDLKDLQELGTDVFNTLGADSLQVLTNKLNDRVDTGSTTDNGITIEEYNRQFVHSAIPLPAIAQVFTEDSFFAYQRLAGPNPVMLERVWALSGDCVSDRFPVTNDIYQTVMGHEDSLHVAAAEQRLYTIDYAALAGALNGTYPHYQKYIAAPKALFAVPRDRGALRPVAIQCGQRSDLPLILPAAPDASEGDRYAWAMAKTVVQVADANMHEAVVHLGRTHLFLSPFVMATHRQFVKSHPLYKLLIPHFEGTLSINNGAQSMLIAPKGGVDSILAATIDSARLAAIASVVSYGFNSAMLPDQLRRRGVDNVEALPLYPYRDDALLLWEAIHAWVSDYVGIFYVDDAAVRSDSALQAWAAELQAFDGGRVPDFGEGGSIQTRDYLIRALTLIIYTASAQHAAVNFPQGDQMVYTPAVPLAAYVPFDGRQPASEADYWQQLPPLAQSESQLDLTYLLGSLYHTQLGGYKDKWFGNAEVERRLSDFQKRLQEIEAIVDARNEQRPYPYPYLKPSRIPQSINI